MFWHEEGALITRGESVDNMSIKNKAMDVKKWIGSKYILIICWLTKSINYTFKVIVPIICILSYKEYGLIYIVSSVVTSWIIAVLTLRLYQFFIIYNLEYKCDVNFALKLADGISNLLKKKVNFKIFKMQLYFIIGDYQKLEEQLEKLNTYKKSITSIQLLRLYCFLAVCCVERNDIEQFETNQEMFYTKLNTFHIRTKSQLMYIDRLKQQLSNAAHRVNADSEQLLQEYKRSLCKVQNPYEQVVLCYRVGECLLKLGRKEEALEEFSFVIQNGGNTKFVTESMRVVEEHLSGRAIRSKELSEKILEEVYRQKWKIKNKGIVISVLILLIIFQSVIVKYNPNTMNFYHKKYYTQKEEINIIHSETFDQYTLELVKVNNTIGYHLFERKPQLGAYSYRIVKSHYEYVSFLQVADEFKMKNPQEKDTYYFIKNSIMENYIKSLSRFYKKNSILENYKWKYIGIFDHPLVEDIIRKERNYIVKEIVIDNETWYFFEFDSE